MANLRKVDRVFHPWWAWECYKAGFYETIPPVGVSTTNARRTYATFLKDIKKFERAIEKVFRTWPNSCEHFLTDPHINRVAWLGQASMCIETKVPATFRSGFFLLSEKQQKAANMAAYKKLEKWLNARKN